MLCIVNSQCIYIYIHDCRPTCVPLLRKYSFFLISSIYFRFEFELEDKAVLPKSKSLKTSTPACKDMFHSVPDVSEISSDSDVR